MLAGEANIINSLFINGDAAHQAKLGFTDRFVSFQCSFDSVLVQHK